MDTITILLWAAAAILIAAGLAGLILPVLPGAPLLFGRLWEDTGCKAVVEALLAERLFEFPVERAVFASVLHRLLVSGSDRACEKWMTDYAIPGADGLALALTLTTDPQRIAALFEAY